MVLTIRATASAPRAAMPGVITASPSAKFWRSLSFSAAMRAVLLSMTDLQIFREREFLARDGPESVKPADFEPQAWLRQRAGSSAQCRTGAGRTWAGADNPGTAE